MDSLFFDILGALIGLVTVLLLLSMVVTALVQASQALFRLRGRNLLFCLTSVIAEQMGISGQEAKEKAREIINAKAAPMLRGHIDPFGAIGKLAGPQVSWLDVDDLRRILGDCTLNVDENERENIIDGFKNVERAALSKRFLRNMRLWTIVWALPVAFYFQVSVPAVLNDFLSDPELRARALQVTPDVQAHVDASLGRQVSYQDVSARALECLAELYPQHRDVIEEASGVGQSKGDIVGELSLVLKDNLEGPGLVDEYERLLDELYEAQLHVALDDAGMAVESLSRLNIDPWREDWEFYVRSGRPQWSNVVGVLMTMILLSFGAAFWFNALCQLVNLRDSLKPIKKDKESPSS